MTICLFGAANERIGNKYQQEMIELGRAIAQHGHMMIYGAGTSGLMGAAARGMRHEGGFIIGVTPHFMHKGEATYPCSRLIQTSTIAERKSTFEKRGDAFIVAPGGLGTYDEFFQILTLKELHQLQGKPVVLYNIDGYFNIMLASLHDGCERGFVQPSVFELFKVSDNPVDALQYLESKAVELGR